MLSKYTTKYINHLLIGSCLTAIIDADDIKINVTQCSYLHGLLTLWEFVPHSGSRRPRVLEIVTYKFMPELFI